MIEWHSSKTRAGVWDKTSGRCWFCGIQTNPWRTFWVEHIIPRSRGGSNKLENLVPSCKTCNGRKGDKTLEQFRYKVATYHGFAPTREFAEWRREHYGEDTKVTRLVFYFETLENADEEALKQGADELFYFTDPEYFTERDFKRFLKSGYGY